MNYALAKFLQEHEGEEVWILIAPGLIDGTLRNVHEPGNQTQPLKIQILHPALHLTDRKLFLFNLLTIPVDQIYAWGAGTPEFMDLDKPDIK